MRGGLPVVDLDMTQKTWILATPSIFFLFFAKIES